MMSNVESLKEFMFKSVKGDAERKLAKPFVYNYIIVNFIFLPFFNSTFCCSRLEHYFGNKFFGGAPIGSDSALMYYSSYSKLPHPKAAECFKKAQNHVDSVESFLLRQIIN